ncbi:bifunctional RNase H/acid phosphatase [compost metagenome]
MNTCIYMIRHGESPKTEGNERTRGLSEKGRLDSEKIIELLKDEGITGFVSSPYKRAVMTIEGLAQFCGQEVSVIEDLKEFMFSTEDKVVGDQEVYAMVRKMFETPDYVPPMGESMTECQQRSVAALKEILTIYKGQRVAIGTHGLVMTLMMNHFDNQYGYEFLMNTSKPDIYKMEFNEDTLVNIDRICL